MNNAYIANKCKTFLTDYSMTNKENESSAKADRLDEIRKLAYILLSISSYICT